MEQSKGSLKMCSHSQLLSSKSATALMLAPRMDYSAGCQRCSAVGHATPGLVCFGCPFSFCGEVATTRRAHACTSGAPRSAQTAAHWSFLAQVSSSTHRYPRLWFPAHWTQLNCRPLVWYEELELACLAACSVDQNWGEVQHLLFSSGKVSCLRTTISFGTLSSFSTWAFSILWMSPCLMTDSRKCPRQLSVKLNSGERVPLKFSPTPLKFTFSQEKWTIDPAAAPHFPCCHLLHCRHKMSCHY